MISDPAEEEKFVNNYPLLRKELKTKIESSEGNKEHAKYYLAVSSDTAKMVSFAENRGKFTGEK